MKEFEIEYLKKVKINIISWYNFKENSDIYIVGTNIEEFVKYLKNKNQKVFSKNLNDSNQLYDYIIVFDELNCLDDLNRYLKPDGIIILILNNKYGIKRFAILEEIEQIANGLGKGYTKNQIEEKIKKCGYKNYKFYYPLPDYNTANVIFSDDFLPDYNNSKLLNNNYYTENTILLFNELNLLKEITKANKFSYFTNSYFIEINNRSLERFIGFNNTRKDEYRLCTKVYNDIVTKEPLFPESNGQLNRIKENIEILKNCGIKSLDTNDEEKVYSKFVSSKPLDQTIVDLILNNNTDKAIKLIKEYYQFLKDKFKDVKTDKLNQKFFEKIKEFENLYIIKKGLIDLVFENIFVIDGEYFIFDQEWMMEDVPVEFILYRAINNMYIYNSQIENVLSKKDIYMMFGIEKYISNFKDAEEKFQKEVVDSQKMEIYKSNRKYITNIINDAKQLEIDKNRLESDKIELEKTNASQKCEIKQLEEKKNELQKEIEKLSEKGTNLENKIKELQEKNNQLENEIKELQAKNNQLENEIKIIKNDVETKQLTINYYENMRVVKFIRKLKNK